MPMKRRGRAPRVAPPRLPPRRRIKIDEPDRLWGQLEVHFAALADRIAADLELRRGIRFDGDLLDEVIEDDLEVLVLPLPDGRKIGDDSEGADRRDAQVHAIGALLGEGEAPKAEAVIRNRRNRRD